MTLRSRSGCSGLLGGSVRRFGCCCADPVNPLERRGAVAPLDEADEGASEAKLGHDPVGLALHHHTPGSVRPRGDVGQRDQSPGRNPERGAAAWLEALVDRDGPDRDPQVPASSPAGTHENVRAM